MPQRVVCQSCGEVLYEGNELRRPIEIVQRYNGRCPRCDRSLSMVPTNVEVRPTSPIYR